MKKQKGFTLVELATTVLVMGVIALIATKVIGGIIREIKEKGFENSTYGYIKAANTYYEDQMVENTFSQVVVRYGNRKANKNILKVESMSYVPDVGTLQIYTGGNVGVAFYDKTLKMCAYKNNDEDKVKLAHVDTASQCTFDGPISMPEGEDITGLCYNTLSYDDNTNFLVLNVEGLVCLSKQVDSGKNFNGKIIKQVNNLDIENDSTYADASTDFYGDINDDGTVDELKKELTTGKGFNPIGFVNLIRPSDNKSFYGTYEGYGFEISNLYINRPEEDGMGLFALNQGTIMGLNILAVDITGRNYVAGVVANNKNMVKEIKITGKVTGDTYVAGATGANESGTGSILVNADLYTNNPNETANIYMGAITGAITGRYGSSNGIAFGGSLNKKFDSQVNVQNLIGTNNNGQLVGYYSTSFKNPVTCQGTYGMHLNPCGTPSKYDTINAYDMFLDTWIGGDNDSDGYYFDYNNEDEMIVKSTFYDPITFDLAGSGTEEDPYLINDYEDYREATTRVKGAYTFMINKDIDFKDKNYYQLGTYVNQFDGHLIGNMHDLKNLTIKGRDHVGLSGYINNGIIEGLNIKNSVIRGYDYAGTIVGVYSGDKSTTSIKGINIINTDVEGENYVGGIAGDNNNIIKEVKVIGKVTGNTYIGGGSGASPYATTGILVNADLYSTNEIEESNIYMGGISGAFTGRYSNVIGIVQGGSLNKKLASQLSVNNMLGTNSSGGGTGYYSKNLKNSVPCTGVCLTGYGYQRDPYGEVYKYDSINTYDNYLDTWIGGDNDSSGYYFDYENSNSDNIVVKSTEKDPITFNLVGEGTEENPYLIGSYEDFRDAVTRTKGGYTYLITKDIDFKDKHFYQFGTGVNLFEVHLIGNMHTLKNILVTGQDHVGITGVTNYGVIEGLNIKNIVAKGRDKVGGVVGWNSGDSYSTSAIRGINLLNGTILGRNNVGGIAGQNNFTVAEVKTTGSVTGETYVGGVVGRNNNTADSLLTSANVYSTDETAEKQIFLGGLVGAHEGRYTYTYGVVNGGSLNKNVSSQTVANNISGSFGGSILEGYYTDSLINKTVCPGTMVNQLAPCGTPYSSTYRNSLEYLSSLKRYNKSTILESPYTGDVNATGYYFDYTNNGNDIVVVKAYDINNVGTTAPKEDPQTTPGASSTGYGVTSSTFSYIPNPAATDHTAPTCTIDLMQILSNGFLTKITCIDNVNLESIRTLRDASPYTGTYDSSSYERVGTTKRGSKSEDGKTITLISRWTTANKTGPYPVKGVCYYYSYSARDTSGNYSIYHTPSCYKF